MSVIQTIRTAENYPARTTTVITYLAEKDLHMHMKEALDAGNVVYLEKINDRIKIRCIRSNLWIAQDPNNNCFARLPGPDNKSLF